jgi:hypothetical protein
MVRFFRSILCLAIALACCATAEGQPLQIGHGGFIYGGTLNAFTVQTVIQLQAPANMDGLATRAVFGWSRAACGGIKIKFFRPVRVAGQLPDEFDFVTERGPFGTSLQPTQTVVQTVTLNPPVPVKTGDVIGISSTSGFSNISACGAPTLIGDFPGGVPPEAPSSLALPGDVTSTVFRGSAPLSRAIYLQATDNSMGLLNRFRLTLVATNPRTGVTATGIPSTIDTFNSSGYFSLPDFTGNATFPEVMVKMVDATRSPALGGGFWVFHAPLTDVSYALTVTDTLKGATRTYTNHSGDSGQLCGEADTSAFPP